VREAEGARGRQRPGVLRRRGAQVMTGHLQAGAHQMPPAAVGLVVDERAAPQHLPARGVGEIEVAGGSARANSVDVATSGRSVAAVMVSPSRLRAAGTTVDRRRAWADREMTGALAGPGCRSSHVGVRHDEPHELGAGARSRAW
jgi:hypothetical protein